MLGIRSKVRNRLGNGETDAAEPRASRCRTPTEQLKVVHLALPVLVWLVVENEIACYIKHAFDA